MNETTDGAFLVALGARIKEIAQQKGISLETLAHLTEKNYPHVTRIVNGQVDLRASSLKHFAQALGISLSTLFEGVE